MGDVRTFRNPGRKSHVRPCPRSAVEIEETDMSSTEVTRSVYSADGGRALGERI